MNDCSHLVNGPCQCAASVAARANDEARKHAAEPYAVGLGVKFSGEGIKATGTTAKAPRLFTRAEVLTVLRVRKAMFPNTLVEMQNELTALLNIFERME